MREPRDSHCPTCGLVFKGYAYNVGVQCDLAHRHPDMWPNRPALEKLRDKARAQHSGHVVGVDRRVANPQRDDGEIPEDRGAKSCLGPGTWADWSCDACWYAAKVKP